MIDLRFVAPDLRRLDEVSAEIVACGVWKDERPLTGLASLLDWRMAGRLSRLARQSFLVGEVGEILVVPSRPRLPFDKVLVAGLGPRASFNDATFRKVLERLLDVLAGLSVKKAVLELPGRGDGGLAPERAAEILLDVVGEEARDGLCFVEEPDGQRRFEKHAQDRHRTALRAQGMR
ncbi:MAG: leucyl aminopeptidase [Labilithrix sp.]|nr:leucyl aminopeptidase [Labilithrix sp.]